MNDLSARALLNLQEARRYVLRDENDGSRDDLLVDAVNYVSEAIWEHCRREFLAIPVRSGNDGVTNGTTTFVAASGAFTIADVGALVNIATKGLFHVVSFTNATTVVLDGSPSAGTSLAWSFGETRAFELGARGRINLDPYDLRTLDKVTLYSDRDAGVQKVLTAGEYRLRPVGRSPAGTYLSIQTNGPEIAEAEPRFGWEATVTGEWGMASVPEVVKLACAQWVENIVKNPGSFASQSMSGFTVTPEVEIGAIRTGMPPAVRRRLELWTRGGLVA